MTKTLGITLSLLLLLSLASCATSVLLTKERAEFYKVEAERIFTEQAELMAQVVQGMTVEQRETYARLMGEIVAFWKSMLGEISVSDGGLDSILDIIAQLMKAAL